MTAHSPAAAKAPQLASGGLQPHPAPAAGHGAATCVPRPSPIFIRVADRRRDRLSRPGGRAAGSSPAPLLGGRLWPPRHSHRRSTWVGRRLPQARLVLALAGLLVVGGAGPAQAHVIGVGGRASNYRTEDLEVTPPVPGLTVRVLEAGNQLELINHSGQEVVVLGYRSEPYLRVGPAGVYENQRSPSAYANRYANPPKRSPTGLDPAAPPRWRRIRNRPEAVWHDHRSHWSGPDPPAVTADRGHRQVMVANWQIPLRLGQRTALIQGDIVWVPGPSPWPWVLLALVAFVVVAAAGWRRWYVLLALLVVVAVAADLVHTAGAFAASTAPVVAKVYGFFISAAGWVAAIAAVWQLRHGRREAGQLLLLLAGMFLAFAGALPDVGALARSQLASTLDPTLTRATIALTLGLGLGMLAASLLIPNTTRPATRPHPRPG
jgi:hypothetical protein